MSGKVSVRRHVRRRVSPVGIMVRSIKQRHHRSGIETEAEAGKLKETKRTRFGVYQFEGAPYVRRAFLEKDEDAAKTAKAHPTWLLVPTRRLSDGKKVWYALEPEADK